MILTEATRKYFIPPTSSYAFHATPLLSLIAQYTRYADGSTLLVKKQDTLNEGDIAILSINGESFCRKFHYEKGKEYFAPINQSPEYHVITASESNPVTIQGKVVGVYSEST